MEGIGERDFDYERRFTFLLVFPRLSRVRTAFTIVFLFLCSAGGGEIDDPCKETELGDPRSGLAIPDSSSLT